MTLINKNLKVFPPFINSTSMIAAGVITADKITVNQLSALSADLGTITAGSITGIIITGGTLQTALTGQRIRIVSSGATSPTQAANSLMLIDSSGNDILDFGSNSSIILRILPASDVQGISIQNISSVALTLTLAEISVLNSSSSGKALSIEQDGSGSALSIVGVNTSLTNYLVTVFSSTYGRNLVSIESDYAGGSSNTMFLLNKTGVGAGNNLDIENAGSGYSIYVNHSGNGEVALISNSGSGRTLEIDSTSSSNNNNVVLISNNSSNAATLALTGALISGHFQKVAAFGSVTIYSSDGTSPSGSLSANAGDWCFNTGSGHAAYCTGTTNWTQL